MINTPHRISRLFQKQIKISYFFVFISCFFVSTLYAQSNIDQATRGVDRLSTEVLERALPPIPERPPEIDIEHPPVEQEAETKFFMPLFPRIVRSSSEY